MNIQAKLIGFVLLGLNLPAFALNVVYDYDNLSRLKEVNYGNGQQIIRYSYDAAGNLLNVTTINQSYNPSDSDGDGIPDSWEIQYGLNPFSNTDASQDTDGDGRTNLAEYQPAVTRL